MESANDSTAPHTAPSAPRAVLRALAALRPDAAALRALIVLGLLPNIFLLPTVIWGSRALIKIEYLVLAAVSRHVSRAMLGALLAITLLLDLVVTFAPVFNFTPDQVVDAVQQLASFRGRTAYMAAVFLACVAATAALLAAFGTAGRARRATSDRRSTFATSVAVALVVMLADLVNGTGAFFTSDDSRHRLDIATSIVAGEYARGVSGPPAVGDRIAAATDSLRAALADDSASLPRKIVVVVVESMGYPRGADEARIFAPFMTDAIARRYRVRTGSLPFVGGTTAGELRELCGVTLWYEKVIERGIDLDCLPTRLAARGYESVAWHGYNGAMFARTEWWPLVGFDRIAFDADIARRGGGGVARCGVLFNGVCDSSIVAVLRDELTRAPEKPQFLYWLTLTSHFPIAPKSGAPRVCEALGAPGESQQICDLWSSLWPVLEGIASLAADPAVPPAWYILVGDHAPPRLLSEFPERLPLADTGEEGGVRRFFQDRRRFSPDHVALIELRPRTP